MQRIGVWEEAIVDRVKLMVERDKNRFCIVMWSMGNESAYGCHFEKALEWTKNYDPDRITQYESASFGNAFQNRRQIAYGNAFLQQILQNALNAADRNALDASILCFPKRAFPFA